MDTLQSLVSVGLIFTFFLGQLFRINIGTAEFPALDIFLVILAVVNAVYNKFKIKNIFLFAFLIFSWINLLLNIYFRHFSIFVPALYLLRLTALFSFFIYKSEKELLSKPVKKFFVLALIANVFFGLVQYFLWPDLTYFKALNWDDHLYRLVSTFIDPTFTGLVYLLFLIWLYLQKHKNIFLLFVTYMAMSLTYSRSTMLSLITASVFLGYTAKNIKIIILTVLIVVATIIALPRLEGEGTKLERTSSISAKIVNYQQAWQTFTKSAVTGFGYNTLPFIINALPGSHSNSGYDSSLLTILATSGILGFSLFGLGLLKLFSGFSLLKKTMLIAILTHSLFANSLLYPWVLLCLVLF